MQGPKGTCDTRSDSRERPAPPPFAFWRDAVQRYAMTKRFCPNCKTLHDGHCSPRALAAAGGKASGGGSPKPKDAPAKAVTAKPAAKPEHKRVAPKSPKAVKVPPSESLTDALGLPPETAIDWKARYEALIVGQRKATLERVRRHRAKAKKAKSKKGKKS